MTEQPNGSIKRWHLAATIVVAIFVPFLETVFFAGGTSARVDLKFQVLDEEVSQIKQEYARKDVIEQRLLNIETSQKHQEQTEIELAKTLDDIRMRLIERKR